MKKNISFLGLALIIIIFLFLIGGIYYIYTYVQDTRENPDQVLEVYDENKDKYLDCMDTAKTNYTEESLEFEKAIEKCQIKYPRNFIEENN